jgi:hypothetical protein
LLAEDFKIYGRDQGHGLVALGNLLLYGQTADIKAAKRRGTDRNCSDWSPSGARISGELKVARLVSQEMGNIFSDRDIVSMATRELPRSCNGSRFLDRSEAGKRAILS